MGDWEYATPAATSRPAISESLRLVFMTISFTLELMTWEWHRRVKKCPARVYRRDDAQPKLCKVR
jgi:hypothetical protein